MKDLGDLEVPRYDPALANLNLDRDPVVPVEESPNLESRENMEEDLAQLIGAETIFSPETNRRITEEAFRDVATFLAPRISKTQFMQVFPNYDPKKPLTLAVSNIKVHIINATDFFDGIANFHEPNDPFIEDAAAVQIGKHRDVDTGALISTASNGAGTVIFASDTFNQSDVYRTNTSPEVIEQLLRHKLVHEILHGFSVAANLPYYLEEGIVERYAQQIVYGDTITEPYSGYTSYPSGVSSVKVIAETMTYFGYSPLETDKMLLGGSKRDAAQLFGILTSVYGDKVARGLFTTFEYDPGSLNDELVKKHTEITSGDLADFDGGEDEGGF